MKASAKPSGAGFDLWVSGAVLLAVMVGAMWFQRPSPACTMPPEAARRLVLARDIDRDHLSRDRSDADRIARRFIGAAPGSPEEQGRFEACETTLVGQIMTAHGLTADQVRRPADHSS